MKSDDYFLATMKLPALFAPLRSSGWGKLTSLSAAAVLCFGCESKGAADAPRPARTVKEHPAFALPKTPEMRADPEPSAFAAADAQRQKPPAKKDKKDWQASCKIQTACAPETQPIPTCDAQVPQRPWVDVVTEGDAVLDKEVVVSGTLGLSLIKKTGSGTCAPGACCHTLAMQIVLVGEPNGSLPLRGLTCSGDDSVLCCSVPAEGQAVVARGRLQKAGAGKWQLSEPTLCAIDNTPRH
ncbi:MAG TPA: hypothetical protein VJV79_40160 [Polyangiaceae bacterium]|nr:hypothetical protein [Polyangiaceae bacterium]